MKAYKKIALLLAVIMLLSAMTACLGTEEAEATTDVTTTQTTDGVTTTETQGVTVTTTAQAANTDVPSAPKNPTKEDFLALMSIVKAKIRTTKQVWNSFRTISETEVGGRTLSMRYDTSYRTDLRDAAAPLMSYMTTVYSPDPSAEIVYYYKDGYFYTSLSGERFKHMMTPDVFLTKVAENPIVWLTKYSADSQTYNDVRKNADGSITADITLKTSHYLPALLDLIKILSEEENDVSSVSSFDPVKLSVTVSAEGVLIGYTIDARFTTLSAGGVPTNHHYTITETDHEPNETEFIPNRSELNTFTDMTGKDSSKPNKPASPK